jgi:hypothetical protein
VHQAGARWAEHAADALTPPTHADAANTLAPAYALASLPPRLVRRTPGPGPRMPPLTPPPPPPPPPAAGLVQVRESRRSRAGPRKSRKTISLLLTSARHGRAHHLLQRDEATPTPPASPPPDRLCTCRRAKLPGATTPRRLRRRLPRSYSSMARQRLRPECCRRQDRRKGRGP